MTQFTLLKLCIWLFEKSNQQLGGLQQEVLMEAIRGIQLRDIQVSGFSPNYIQRVIAPKLWRQLSVLCGQRVGIRRLRMVLIQKYEQLTPEEQDAVEEVSPQVVYTDDIEIIPTRIEAIQLKPHHGGIPRSNKPFYGQAARLQPLRTCLAIADSSLIFVNGRGGIGKTTLVSHVLMHNFEQSHSIFWCDLSDNTQFSDNLEQISDYLDLPEPGDIAALCDYLTEHPSIIVFDHWELLFAECEFSGMYRPQHQAYAVLLEQIIRQPRAGVVIVITREMAPSMEQAIAAHPDRVKEIQVPALSPASATRIMEEYTLGDRALWEEFITTYRGNPLKLRLLCADIQEWYGGSIKIFRQQNTIIGGDTLREILKKFTQRATAVEREILYWLMLWQHPLTLPQLQEHYREHVTFSSQVWDAVRSLERRFLLEKDSETNLPLLSLQPSIKRYLTQEFVMDCHREITQAIANGYNPKGLHLLNTYDLTIQTANFSQIDPSIMGLIIKSLQQKIPSVSALQEHLTQLQMAVTENMPSTDQKYNLSNLKALNYYLLHLEQQP